jgi:hypothetical protein
VVKPDGVPVAVKPFDTQTFIEVPHVAMTEDTLAMSIGVGMQDELAVLLEDKQAATTPADTPMFVFGYDYARLFAEYDRILSQAPGAPGSMGFTEFAAVFGYTEMRFDVNANGYFADIVLEMNPTVGHASDGSE